MFVWAHYQSSLTKQILRYIRACLAWLVSQKITMIGFFTLLLSISPEEVLKSLFKKDIFLMWMIFKVFIEFVTILLPFYALGFFFFFWLQSMWELSSLTRDWTRTPCVGRQSLNHWTTREVPISIRSSHLVPSFISFPFHCNTRSLSFIIYFFFWYDSRGLFHQKDVFCKTEFFDITAYSQ